MKKLLFFTFVFVIIISTIIFFLPKKENKISTKNLKDNNTLVNSSKTIDVKNNDEKENLGEESKIEEKKNNGNSESNSNNSRATIIEEKNSNNENKSPSTDQEIKTQNEQNNSNTVNNSLNNNTQTHSDDSSIVNKNNIDYSFHKGRTEQRCNTNASCTNQGIEFYQRNKKVVASFFVLDVTTNNGNFMGYFIEYIFKEGEYDTESECNDVGTSIKSELSDRVTGYRCSNINNKYYLNITTDYD